MIRIFSQYVSLKSLLLVGSETVLIAMALLTASMLALWTNQPDTSLPIDLPQFLLQACIFILVFETSFSYCDAHTDSTMDPPKEKWLRVWQALGAGSLLVSLIHVCLPDLVTYNGELLMSILLVAVFVVINRFMLETTWQAAAPKQNVLIIGTRELAQTVAREIAGASDLSLDVAGFIAAEPDAAGDGAPILGRPIMGTVEQLEAVAAGGHISRIVVALEDRRGVLPLRELVKLRMQGIPIDDAPSMLAALSGRVWLRSVQPSWFVFSEGFSRSRATLTIKRVLDIVCGVSGFVLTLPIMALVALVVRLDSKGPVIYRQRRVGLNGRTFWLLKFRSMRQDAEQQHQPQWAQVDDPRVTRVGRILRNHRLDELPQFLNVIRGDMSFVGPRPERPEFVEQLRQAIPYYDERHFVRPGLTGWAQVQYRYGADVNDARRKLEYDLFYLKNLSVLFDLAIILKTVRIVLGAYGSR